MIIGGVMLIVALAIGGYAWMSRTQDEEIAPERESVLDNAITQEDNQESDLSFLGRVWSTKEIYSKKVIFTPPSGYWVYYADGHDAYWIVKGEEPEIGPDDPIESAYQNRVAILYPLTRDAQSFSEWKTFESFMAQFDCMEGATEDDLTVCRSEQEKESSGMTEGGFEYHEFALTAELQKTKEAVGTKSYITAVFNEEKTDGILIRILNQEDAPEVRAIVKSLQSRTQ